MKLLKLLLVASLVLLATVTPAVATSKETVGSRINLLTGTPTTFPKDTPFHIAQGWLLSSKQEALGKFDFVLEVDGVLRKEDFVLREAVSEDTLRRLWVHNFVSGLTGTHTFTGRWFGPCQPFVDAGVIPGPCPTPNEKVEVLTRTRTVNFD